MNFNLIDRVSLKEVCCHGTELLTYSLDCPCFSSSVRSCTRGIPDFTSTPHSAATISIACWIDSISSSLNPFHKEPRKCHIASLLACCEMRQERTTISVSASVKGAEGVVSEIGDRITPYEKLDEIHPLED